MFDPFFPAGEAHYWKSTYLASLDDDAVNTIASHVASRPSPMSMVGLWALGGALGRVDPTATATGNRSAPFVVEILANWTDPEQADANIDWAQQLFEAMTPFSTGKTNLNFPGLGDDPGFVRAALGDNWDRLVDVKRTYDPTNLFRLNQNIEPPRQPEPGHIATPRDDDGGEYDVQHRPSTNMPPVPRSAVGPTRVLAGPTVRRVV